MIREASIYDLKRLSAEERAVYGLRVLTMRTWPRGIRRSDIDLWIPSAAPSPQLLAAYRAHQISWHDFTIAYRASQIMARSCRVVDYRQAMPIVQVSEDRALDHLRRLERDQGTITLLCWEREALCHRFLLKELVESPDLEAGMACGEFFLPDKETSWKTST